MEAKIKFVSETAEISMEDAQMALGLADGEVERALELVPLVEKSQIVVHGKFVCGKSTKLFGIFQLIGNGREGQLYEFGLAMSYTQSDVDTQISASPEALKKIIEEMFHRTENNQVHSFLGGFYDQLGVAQIYQLYSLAKEQKNEGIAELFREMVGRIWGGSERVEVEVETFLMTKVQCEKKGLLLETGAATTEEDSLSPNLTIYLETEPMISPIKGKTIDKFTLNELIPVKIVDTREAGRYLGGILSNQMGIAVGRLKDIYLNEVSNRYQVTVEFGPKINGRFVIEPAVRLATYTDMLTSQPMLEDGTPVGEVENPIVLTQNLTLFLLIGCILLVVIFFLLTR